MKLGFIGTGIITTSVVTGFCESGMENLQIVVSPRNKERAQMLHEKYPEIVSVAADNQEVVDRSDWVFAALLPKAAEDILKPLHIGPEKKFINLVATLSLKRIEEMFGPREILADVVPLTFAANRFGPVVIYPDIPEVVDLMSHVGKPVPVDTPKQIAILRSTTGLMSAYYMLLTVIIQWCERNGLDEPSARAYIHRIYWGAVPQGSDVGRGSGRPCQRNDTGRTELDGADASGGKGCVYALDGDSGADFGEGYKRIESRWKSSGHEKCAPSARQLSCPESFFIKKCEYSKKIVAFF